MARINVYVPDDLAAAARSAELNVSAITQDAIRTVLSARSAAEWLDSPGSLEPVVVSSDAGRRALDEAREELWGDG